MIIVLWSTYRRLRSRLISYQLFEVTQRKLFIMLMKVDAGESEEGATASWAKRSSANKLSANYQKCTEGEWNMSNSVVMTNCWLFVVCHAGCCDDVTLAWQLPSRWHTPEVVLDHSRTPVSWQKSSRVKASLATRRGCQRSEAALAPAEARGYWLS